MDKNLHHLESNGKPERAQTFTLRLTPARRVWALSGDGLRVLEPLEAAALRRDDRLNVTNYLCRPIDGDGETAWLDGARLYFSEGAALAAMARHHLAHRRRSAA